MKSAAWHGHVCIVVRLEFMIFALWVWAILRPDLDVYGTRRPMHTLQSLRYQRYGASSPFVFSRVLAGSD